MLLGYNKLKAGITESVKITYCSTIIVINNYKKTFFADVLTEFDHCMLEKLFVSVVVKKSDSI